MKVSREQVLAYRIAEQGLHRDAATLSELALLELGIQDTSNATARLAISTRLRKPVKNLDDVTLLWSYRGAPHLHRDIDIADLPAALWPLSESDAISRLSWDPRRRQAAAMPALDAISVTAQAIRDKVREPMSKGSVSRAVTETIPAGLSLFCRGCDCVHVNELLLRIAALPGGARLEIDTYPAVLAPLNKPQEIPKHSTGIGRLLTAYLRFLGPATPTDAASFFDSTRKEILAHWPDELAEVDVDGKAGFLPADRLDALREPAQPPHVRLLPPYDPYLHARDRDLLTPDKAEQKELWKILGNPGALLVDGEIVGTWRRKSSKSTVDITVRPFHKLTTTTIRDIEKEAEIVAQVRNAKTVKVHVLND